MTWVRWFQSVCAYGSVDLGSIGGALQMETWGDVISWHLPPSGCTCSILSTPPQIPAYMKYNEMSHIGKINITYHLIEIVFEELFHSTAHNHSDVRLRE